MIRKTTILMVMVLAIAFLGFALVAFGLPKDKQAAGTSSVAAPAPAQKQAPTQLRKAPVVPLDAEPAGDLLNFNRTPRPMPAGYQAPAYRIGATRQTTAAVPFVNVRTGIPETPGGNNHMRRQVKASPGGDVHMVYRVTDVVNDTFTVTAADSNTNGTMYYNAYDCGGAPLRNASKDVQLSQVFSGIGDDRPRIMLEPGIFVPNPATGVPVAYGARLIQRTDLGNGLFSRRGWATMKDGAECLGLFTMDTSQTTTTGFIHPVMHPINASTWFATGRNGGCASCINYSFTTDAGATWSPLAALPSYSPWFNSVEITGVDTTFYVVSMTDPADINAFQTTERPVYLRGDYHPLSGTITFGTMTDIPAQAGVTEVGYLGNMTDIAATMVGETLHVAWMDWNNWLGQNIGGNGGHVHSARVLPDGSVPGIQTVAYVNIDGRLPTISTVPFGFAIDPWSQIELSYDAADQVLYALWTQPPPDSTGGVPNFQWGDYEASGTLANMDILCSASPNNGRGWDEPTNITQTNNPGCTGDVGDECIHEYWFSADDRASNDTLWIVAKVNGYPGYQEAVLGNGDVGPYTQGRDFFRLYKAPARAPVLTARGALAPPPGDTLNPFAILMAPGDPAGFNANLRLSNIGLLGFLTDSITIDVSLNDGFLVTTAPTFNPGEFVPVAGGYNFAVNFNGQLVTPTSIGGREGVVSVFIHTNSPATSGVIHQDFSVYIIPNLCLNRKVRIHSASNTTDVGSQGSIKDQGGNGLNYAFNNSDRFYDGGVWIANSDLTVDNFGGIPNVPRKVTRQIFSDKFLRCLDDIVLDSTPGTGAYYNLYAVSVATDVGDSTIVYKNVYEQSTHADSSDFLLHTVKVINISDTPIDSVAMGVIYDIDVFGASNPAENVTGDTSVSHNGRKFWLGWVAGNDVSIDTCSPNNEMYGVVIIPNGVPLTPGNPGDSIHPRGAVMYHQFGFSYDIGFGTVSGGDSLCERYSWNLDVCTSTRRRTTSSDTLSGAWQDTLPPLTVCNGDAASGPSYRADEGYMAIAKKVYNFPTNQTAGLLVSRYGLDGLAAGIDSAFSGEGESYTVIHVGSNNGLSDLMTNAVKGIDWYSKHAGYQAGPYQSVLRRGDLDNSGGLTPTDVVLELNWVFLEQVPPNGLVQADRLCAADLNLDNVYPGTASDVVLLLQGTFLCDPPGSCPQPNGCPWCMIRCP
jgi:hypothetical protein